MGHGQTCGECRKRGHNRRSCQQLVGRRWSEGLRKCVGETVIRGEIHQVMACGHSMPALLDEDGMWVHEERVCQDCKDGVPERKPLYEGEPLHDFRTKAWEKLHGAPRDVRGRAN